MRRFFLFILVVVASIPAVWQVMTPGYFPMHDNTQVVRVYEMHKALLSGQFPVRWVPDLGYGYGYPIFNFYNPLPYYVGAGIMLFGFDALEATKLMMVFGVVLAGISMFLFAKTVLKGPGPAGPGPLWLITALVASTLYVYAPYHAVQIYVRGAVAEYWAYAILPLVFWAISQKKVIAGAIMFAALVLSHNLTAFMALPFVGLFITLQLFKRLNSERQSLFTVYCLLFTVGLGLSAFFWLPALVEAPKTRLSEMVFQEFDLPSKHLVSLSQLWNSSWGYGGSSAGLDDGMSFEIGKIQLIGSVSFLILWLNGSIVKRSKRLNISFNRSTVQPFNRLSVFLILGFSLSIFLMLPQSAAVWDSIPLLSYIQFPWRLLTFTSLFSSLLVAWVIARFFEELKRLNVSSFNRSLLLIFISLSTIYYLLSTQHLQPQFKFPTSAAELTSRERIVWEVSKRSDEYLPLGFIRPKSLEEALRGGNLYNQRAVDDIKKPTIARRVGNLISFLFLLLLIILIWKGRTLRQGPTF